MMRLVRIKNQLRDNQPPVRLGSRGILISFERQVSLCRPNPETEIVVGNGFGLECSSVDFWCFYPVYLLFVYIGRCSSRVVVTFVSVSECKTIKNLPALSAKVCVSENNHRQRARARDRASSSSSYYKNQTCCCYRFVRLNVFFYCFSPSFLRIIVSSGEERGLCVFIVVWRNGAVRKMRFSVFVFVPCFFLVDVFFFLLLFV